jgi:hypothetical protein
MSQRYTLLASLRPVVRFGDRAEQAAVAREVRESYTGAPLPVYVRLGNGVELQVGTLDSFTMEPYP